MSVTMVEMKKYKPTFDIEMYKASALEPLIIATVLTLLYFLFGLAFPNITPLGGFGNLINLLFTLWIARNVYYEGGNTGDSAIVSFIVGLIIGLIGLLYILVTSGNFTALNLFGTLFGTSLQFLAGGLVFFAIFFDESTEYEEEAQPIE
jgi:hypothetical protein